MKVVTLLGSPRKNGNSAVIASSLVGSLKEKHDSLESSVYYINGLNAKGCQACYACKSVSDKCVVVDGLTEVLGAVEEADIVVIATPVYGGDVTSQMKMVIDRMYSYLVPDFVTNEIKHRLKGGKKIVFIMTQGSPKEIFADVSERYVKFFSYLGLFERSYVMRGCGLNPGTEADLVPVFADEVRGLADKL